MLKRERLAQVYILRFVVLPFLVTVISSVALTYMVRGMTRAMGLLDKPGAHKQHEAPTPTLGGLSVFLAFLIGTSLCGPLSDHIVTVLWVSGALVAVGLLDDMRGVSANVKLLTLGLGSYTLWRHGIHLDVLGSTGFFALALTFLWIGLVSSAFNGVDNADGAAGGLAFISCVTTFAISWVTWQHDLAVISLVLGGACLGFLVFNYPNPKASIFLGDSGSLFLGFGLSVLAIMGEWSQTGWRSATIAFALVVVPLADFCFILISRGLAGHYRRWDDPIKMCARDHTFHRLRALGMGPKGALWSMYSLASCYGVLAYMTVIWPDSLSLLRVAQWFGLLLVFYIGLNQVRLPREAFPATERS